MGVTLGCDNVAPYPRVGLAGEVLSAAYRECRDALLPYGNRLRLKGRADMLKGKQLSPHAHAIRFLLAGKQAGLSKQWALRFVSWLRLMVEALWPAGQTSTASAELDEQQAENAADLARLKYQQTGSEVDRLAWLALEHREVVSGQVMLAAHGYATETM